MKLVENNLYRGPRPKSFAELEAAGITTVINLQFGFYEEFKETVYEKEASEDFGIIEYNVGCSDLTPPKIWQVKKVLEIIENSTGPVYIHCLHGKDRTGFMCAAYRILICGWKSEKAIKEMYAEGFHRWSYFWWVPSLRKLEAM